MTTPVVHPSSSIWLSCTKEAVSGVTEAAPSVWIPVNIPTMNPGVTQLLDTGFRGTLVRAYDQKQGTRSDDLVFRCYAYPDTLPNLLLSVLGGADTVAASGSLYSHAMSLGVPVPVTNPTAQPPTYTWFYWDGLQVMVLGGARTRSIQLTWGKTGLVELEVRVLGGSPFVKSGTVPSPDISDVPPSPAWSVRMTENSVAKNNLVRCVMLLDRELADINTMAGASGQSGYAVMAATLGVTAKLEVLNNDDAELDLLLNDNTWPFAFNFTGLSAANFSFGFTMTRCKASTSGKQQGSDGLVTTMLDLLALPNSTDSTAGGVSPIKTTVLNSRSSAY